MRRSVMVGLGLWLFAVVSVAGIAWIAIDRAGRQVTNVSATALAPNINGVQMPLIGAVAEVPLVAPVSPVPAPDARRTAPTTSRSSARAYVASFTTDGGRIRAQCVNQKASLDGGYARPEPGWQVKVLARDGKVWVVFGSSSEAIGVVAQCVNGRPRFEQRTQTLTGAPVPEPSLSVQSTPTMSPLSAVPQSLSSPTEPAASPSLRDVAGSDGEPGSRFGQRWTTPASSPASTPAATPSVTPADDTQTGVTPADDTQTGVTQTGVTPAGGTQTDPLLAAEPDAAEVSRYLTLADQFCSDLAHASDWCRQWQALTPLERYVLVAHWLEAQQAADARAASGAASEAPSGGENGGRDHWRNHAGAAPAH